MAALAIPLLCLLAVIVAEVVETTDDLHDVREQTVIATAAIGPNGLMSALQDERNWAVVDLIGQSGAVTLRVTGYEETRRLTDEAILAFRRDVTEKGGAVAEAYGPAIEGLADLAELRAQIDAFTGPRDLTNNDFADVVFSRYAALIEPFNDGNTRLALAVGHKTLRTGVELIDVLSRQIETVGTLIRDILQGGLNDGIEREDIAIIAAGADEFRRQAETIAQAADPYRDPVAQAQLDAFATEVLGVADSAVEGQVDVAGTLAVANVPVESSYHGRRDDVSRRLLDEASAIADSASRRVALLRAAGTIAVALAAIASWVVSRSITAPLRALTRQAKHMADHRLPEAVGGILDTPLGDDVVVPAVETVTVDTSDEVADVAQALNTVQDSALHLAFEQAVLRRNIADSFVNLGRRNQTLLSRQLNFITELEANETDPDTLANLFRLDHLATRMRRNAESLLLLAGVEPPRTWSGPVRVNDVIRAALGEVEEYQRVVDRGIEPAMVLGSAAADLAHLLAELIDNALIYSPPDQPVEVRGGRRTEAAPGGYTLAVIDAGLGMRPDELARANRRLAGAESFTIAPSKYLGHYVAGHLAARHDIRVTLHPTQGGGVTALVEMPPSLLVEPAPMPPGPPMPTVPPMAPSALSAPLR
ncbi:MAG TPA: ATP-binding protein [Acidimicrobiales bacterium]